MKVITKLRNLFSKKRSESLEPLSSNLYDDIFTLPAWNYRRVYAKGSLKYLLIDDKIYTPINKIMAKWIDIQQQMMDEFGQSDKQERYFELIKEAIPYLLDSIICNARGDIQGRRRNEFDFEMRMAKANALLTGDGSSEGEWKKAIDKMMGRTINLKEISAWDYENYKHQLANG